MFYEPHRVLPLFNVPFHSSTVPPMSGMLVVFCPAPWLCFFWLIQCQSFPQSVTQTKVRCLESLQPEISSPLCNGHVLALARSHPPSRYKPLRTCIPPD
jgi:hypothetical protein